MLNPYGYDNSWRKNGPNTGVQGTSGVDLNRNFDFRWDRGGSTNPDHNEYRGPSAASEPETQAIRNFVLAQRPVFGITFHSGSRRTYDGSGNTVGEIMYPWNALVPALDPPDPPDRDRLIVIADVIAEAIEASRGGVRKPNLEDAGTIGQSNVYHHGVTGMFDYMLETSEIKWSRAGLPFFL